MGLTTFAFLHRPDAETLAAMRAACEGVEILVPEGDAGVPAGIERAEAASLSWNGPAIDDVLDAASSLRWLQQRGAGIDRIATPKLIASPVMVTNGSGNHATNIAEHALALMLAFARQLPGLVRAQGARSWQPPASDRVFELSGQTLAVVGVGALGAALAIRAAALGMRVLGVRRSGSAGEPVAGVAAMHGPEALDAVLGEADHVVITLPLTSETRGLFDARRFAAMKHGAHLYNVGRGAIVDSAALLAALQGGRLGGAGLDVTDPEPLPSDSPLWSEPNVIVTAHSAGETPRSLGRWRALLLDNVARFRVGEPLRNVVDKSLGY